MPSRPHAKTLMPGLLLSLSISLAACATSPEGAKAVRPETPRVPARYATCFNALALLPTPEGGWTLEKAVAAQANTRTSENEKRKCGQDLIAWTNGVLDGVRGAP